MINYIKGQIIFVNVLEGTACVFANGIGHAVTVGGRLAQNMQVGQEVSLFVETIVKEDSISLYGFNFFEKKLWFSSLLKVSGVGAKVAMAVIDTFSPAEISNAIIAGQGKVFQSISGLGEKVSQRIVAELSKEVQKNIKIFSACKLSNQQNSQQQSQISTEEDSVAVEIPPKKIKKQKSEEINTNDVTSALCNLGFNFNRSFEVANKAVQTAKTLEEAIKIALAEISAG